MGERTRILSGGRWGWRRCVWWGVRSLGGSVLAACFLLYFDIVQFGWCAYSIAACPLWFAISIVKAVALRTALPLSVARVTVPLVTVLLAISNQWLQTKIAMHNAGIVIQACDAYHETNRVYPDSLEQLVPRYMASIPRAKYCRFRAQFEYVSGGGPHILRWHPSPVFDRMVYTFETCSWRYVD